ncbi:MAG: MOSC domain-containing protein, partial [Pseudomonadota bacterium]|nr:MOSC domain-containing protein [Pseudomonadota bacterium]
KIASIAARFTPENGVLELSHATHGSYRHSIRSEGDRLASKWVLDKFETIDQGDEVAEWLSILLEKNVRLVTPDQPWKIVLPHPLLKRMHDSEKQKFFAASEVSLANRASLDDLNSRLESPVPMDRFRVNVVVDGINAYEEDEMDVLANKNVELLQVSAAERCVIIATDQKTGHRPKNNILQVLGDYRRRSAETKFSSGLLFGNYMTVGREGLLRTGDRLSFA